MVADDNALVDREAAYRAGLGWYGKNANLLLPGRGQLVRARLGRHRRPAATGDRARVADGCGTCTRCLDGCPTGAIVAPGVVDARRCLAWLLQVEGPFPREHRVALGDRSTGATTARRSARPTVGVDRHRGAATDGRRPMRRPARRPASTCSLRPTHELLARHGRWYIPRREARYLRRNALVVLGNVGDGTDPAGGRGPAGARSATPTRWCGPTRCGLPAPGP